MTASTPAEPSAEFRDVDSFGRDEATIKATVQSNGWVSFDVWSQWGGPNISDNEFEQRAGVALKRDEALRFANWLVEQLEGAAAGETAQPE